MITVQVNGKNVGEVATAEDAEAYRPANVKRTVRITGIIINFVTW